MNKESQEDFFIKWIDEIYATTAQGLAPEHLADYTEGLTYTYEITVNIPQKRMTLLQHIEVYKNIWAHLVKLYNTNDHLYFVEYCKSGNAHIHGYLRVTYPENALSIDDEHFVKDIAKQIYLNLPKTYYKQFTQKHVYFPYYRLFKAAAVCINMKNYLHTNWTKYIEKNALK